MLFILSLRAPHERYHHLVDTCCITSTVTAAYLLCETCIGGGLFPRLVFPELRRSSAGARVAVTVPLRHL